MSGYQVNYECDDLGSNNVADRYDDGEVLTIEDAFLVAAQQSADAFFENGGDSYDCTDTSYTVQPQIEGSGDYDLDFDFD